MERSRVLIAVAVAATLAVVAALGVWLANREDDPTAISPTTPSTFSSATTQATGLVVGGAPGDGFVTAAPTTIAGETTNYPQFSSPTGNIGCVLTAELVVCEIGEYDYELPPEPPSCRAEWAATFELANPATVPTLGACQSDTALGAPDQLAYGATNVAGDFACLSQETGMTCWSQGTGHGFTISRAAYALF